MSARSTRRSVLQKAALVPALLTGGAPAQANESSHDWAHYGGDPGATRYSPLDQITRNNVGDLKPAWVHATGDSLTRPTTTIECTPLVIDGRMYLTTAQLQVRALDAASGKPLWNFDPFAGQRSRRAKGVNRGVTYWSDGERELIFSSAKADLFCLDAKTGELVKEFANGGVLDMRDGLDREMGDIGYVHTTPPAIFEDLIILSGGAGEGPGPAPPGHIRAHDVRTGERRWIFHTIPHPGELGYETWAEDNWKTAGGCNCWAGMSVDTDRGVIFAGLGSPTFDFYGADRPGKNLFGNSVVALDARTGKRVWHYQTVHHDLWDYDLAAQPALIRIRRGGEWRDAVVQVTKTGFWFFFDRESGEPLFDIEEREVPESAMPGEEAWPTQPFPTAPPAYTRQGFSADSVTSISDESRAFVLSKLKDLRSEGLFTPPGKQGSVFAPGTMGGTVWGGCSFDPETGYVYINTNDTPKYITLVDAPENAGYPYRAAGYPFFNDEEGYPASKPPWGELLCLDPATAKYVWRVPLGEHAALSARGVPKTGTYNIGGTITTAGGLVVVASTQDERFRAFDAESGETLWEYQLNAGGYATPATYMVDGRQYLVIAAGGGGKPRTKSGDEYVAFALES